MKGYAAGMTQAPTFVDVVAPARPAARNVLLAVLGSLLVTAGAWVTVPMWPVPMTLQPLAVLLVGAAFGSRLGAATLLLYLAQGAMGLPVFAGGGAGAAHLFGPTGGFLMVYPLVAFVVGWLAERGWDRHWTTALATMFLGTVVIFTGGVLWLSMFVGLDTAIATGLLPFVLGDLGKVLVAAAVMPTAWRLFGKA